MYDDHTGSPMSMPHAPATVDNSNGAWSQSNIQLNTHTHAEFHRLTSAGSISTLSISNDDSTPHISHDWEWRRDCLKRHCKHIGWRLLCSGRELSFFSIFSLFKKKKSYAWAQARPPPVLLCIFSSLHHSNKREKICTKDQREANTKQKINKKTKVTIPITDFAYKISVPHIPFHDTVKINLTDGHL